MSDPHEEGHLERALAALVEALDQAMARSGQRMDLERLDRIIGDLGRDLERPEIVESWRRLRGESA